MELPISNCIQLPIELWWIIAMHGPDIYYRVAMVNKHVATLGNELQEALKLQWTTIYNGTWRLPNGWLHRSNGPATRAEWWFNGVRHRADGPAVIEPTHEEYHIRGVLIRIVTYPEIV